MAAARVAAAYPLLLALGALDATGYSVIVPVAPAIADATGTGPATIGLLVASFPAGMVAGFAVAGWAVRRLGPRWLLIASLGLVAAGALGFVVGDSLGVYFAARMLMGLGSGGIWIGVTFDTLERWPGQEYVCMSRVFAAYSAGGLIGPALGAFGGIHGPFFAYLAMLLFAMPLVLFVKPAVHRDFTGDGAVLRTRAFWIASGAILFASLALGVLEGVLPLHLAERVTQAQIGALYVGASLVVATSATASGGRPPRPLVIAAVVFSVAGIALAGIATDVPLWLLALLLAALGIGLGNTGSLGLLVEAVPVERILTAMVVWSQIGIIGYLLGPLTGGIVAEGAGYGYVWLVPATAALLVLVLTRGQVTRAWATSSSQTRVLGPPSCPFTSSSA
jgi:MFS family permease